MSSIEDINGLNRLYLRFCEGDAKAQNILYKTTSMKLYRYIMSNTNVSKEVVAELMQETWINLWKACSTNYKNVNFSTRMYKISSSLVIDHWRAEKKTKKRTTFEEELAQAESNVSETAINKDNFHKIISLNSQRNKKGEPIDWGFRSDNITDDPGLILDVKRTIQALPLLQRQAWILMQDGKNNEEIAHLTESNVEAVRSRIRYANNKIKKLLILKDD